MGSFTNFLRGWKANAFVSHLEFAKHRYFPSDLWHVTYHLTKAVKAMAKMREARSESIMTLEGWVYVAGLAAQLTQELERDGHLDLARDSRYIFDYAQQHLS